jgi:hypothetical protein
MPSLTALGFVLVGIFARIAPHPWNVSPVTAVALFGGVHLPSRWGLLLPVAMLAVTDAILGWHTTMPFTWTACWLTGLIGRAIRTRETPARLAGAVLAGSTVFFLLSNFGVWLVGGLYPLTADGLRACFLAALPFFRSSLIGDAAFTLVLFGGYALASRAPSRAPQPHARRT